MGSLIVLIVVAVPFVVYLRHFRGTSTRLVASRVPLLGSSAITIVPGVHLLGGLDPSAAYVVETSEGLVLVDSGLQSDAKPPQVADGDARARLEARPCRLAHPRPRRPLRRGRAPAGGVGGEGLCRAR